MSIGTKVMSGWKSTSKKGNVYFQIRVSTDVSLIRGEKLLMFFNPKKKDKKSPDVHIFLPEPDEPTPPPETDPEEKGIQDEIPF